MCVQISEYAKRRTIPDSARGLYFKRWRLAKCNVPQRTGRGYALDADATAAERRMIMSKKLRVMQRISKDAYYLEIAKAVAMRSTCLRRQYGAVIVKNDRIISTGYNGSARGEPNCCDVGECWRESHGIPHGEQYEKCVAVHAEDNAISQAGREAVGATLYLAGFENGKSISAVPCAMCERKIKNAQIREVIT